MPVSRLPWRSWPKLLCSLMVEAGHQQPLLAAATSTCHASPSRQVQPLMQRGLCAR